MNIQNWKIFDKKGSFINWYKDSYIQIDFTTDTTNAVAAEAYAVTDPSGFINEIVVENPGYNYNPANTSALLTYTFDPTGASSVLTSVDVSINFIDVSIFNPEPTNSQGIESVDVSINDIYIYPSTSFSGALFLDTVSKGLIETEHLTILEESNGAFIRPYDAESSLIFRFVSEDSEIKLFELDENTQEIVWTDEVKINTDILADNIPITVNIGFKSDEEGVFERRLRIYELRDGIEYIQAEFLVNAQAIPQDERFDTLLQNLAPQLNPKEFPKLFKDADINEDLPDWKLLNQKGKNAVLDYSHITPYIGTYKALINSIKWLGYEDLKIKEWFKDVKHSKKLALDIPYNAKDRTKTILYFSAEERQNLKKLNELSLIYQINKETGEVDEWGTPIVENVYEYNTKEVLIKLSALKTWLEKNIIGVNTRITDITGEGVYFETFKNLIYGVQKHGIDAIFEQKITPITLANNSELISGDSSIRLSLLELEQTKVKDLNYSYRSIITYGYNHDTSINADGVYTVVPTDSSLINNFDASLVRVGPTFKFPMTDINDIMWRAHIKDKSAGVLGNKYVTNPLFIYENEIRYYDLIAEDSVFYDTSTNASLVIEKAFFRNPDNDIWEDDQIMYEIYPDTSIVGNYFMESSLGVITAYSGFAIFNVLLDGTSSLTYSIDSDFKVPLLKFKNYSTTDGSGNYTVFEQNKELILDMVDGKISMDSSSLNASNQVIYETNHINFTNNQVLVDQTITLNTEFSSGRIPLSQYDPSEYYYQQEELNADPVTSLVVDNSIYNLEINHIGDYAIELFSWDSWNNNYYNPYYSTEGDSSTYEVWTKYPRLTSIVESSTAGIDPSIYNTIDVSNFINENLTPIFDRSIHLQNLSIELDSSGNEYLEIPAITFFQDVPQPDSISKIYNLTELIDTTIITDACVWVNQGSSSPISSPNIWRYITYDNDIFVAAGPSKIITSDDGITWTQRSAQSGAWYNIAYGNGVFIIPGSGNFYMKSEDDGITWSKYSFPYASATWFNITFGNNTFVITGINTSRTLTSTDGSTWFSNNGGPSNSGWRALTHGNNLFVSTASSGADFLRTSVDGSVWTARTAAENNSWTGVAYGNGIYCATAFDNNGSNNIMNSRNGVDWFKGTAVNNNGWQHITFTNGIFVANSALDVSTGTPIRVMTSTDGSIWTASYSGITESEWGATAYGDEKIVMISEDPIELMTTNDKGLKIDPDFMSFNINDSINAVLIDKGKYDLIEQMDASIVLIDGNNFITTNPVLPATWLNDASSLIYLRNITARQINSANVSIRYATASTPDYMVVNVSDYTFAKEQLVSFIIKDGCTGFEMGAAYKVIDSSSISESNGVEHVFEGRISNYILNDPSRYSITAKHTFSQYYSTQLDVITATDYYNSFQIYHDDPFYNQNYMDNTFTYVNIPFDQEEVLRQWGENAQYNTEGDYYSYNQFINIDVSSLLVLDATYNVAGYMLNHRNVWTIRNTNDNQLVMKVWNNQLVYVFDEIGTYNVKGEAYDSYGNLRGELFEGMVTVS